MNDHAATVSLVRPGRIIARTFIPGEWRVDCSCGWKEKAATEAEVKERLRRHRERAGMADGRTVG